MPFNRRAAFNRSTLARPAAPPMLATMSWSAPLPQGYVRIAVSRGPLPPGVDLHTMRYPALTPNQSSRDTPPADFHRNYVHRLMALDPEFVFEDIQRMAGPRVPVLCGWPGVTNIAAGRLGCHRHLAADWFERALDIKVPELGAPAAFDRFTWWKMHPMAVSVPGNRPRTGPAPSPTKAARAVRRLQQGSFKF